MCHCHESGLTPSPPPSLASCRMIDPGWPIVLYTSLELSSGSKYLGSFLLYRRVCGAVSRGVIATSQGSPHPFTPSSFHPTSFFILIHRHPIFPLIAIFRCNSDEQKNFSRLNFCFSALFSFPLHHLLFFKAPTFFFSTKLCLVGTVAEDWGAS